MGERGRILEEKKKENAESIGQSQDKGIEGETSSMTDRCSIVTDKMEEGRERAREKKRTRPKTSNIIHFHVKLRPFLSLSLTRRSVNDD